MKFEIFKSELCNMWGVRREDKPASIWFACELDAIHAVTLIESWVDEAVVTVNTNTWKELSDIKHTANAIKALENYNLVKNDEVADYENEVRK